VNGKFIIIGSKEFVLGSSEKDSDLTSRTFVMMDGKVVGFFNFTNRYRKGLEDLLSVLRKKYILKLLSGDSSHEKVRIEKLFGHKAELLFDHKPDEKMNKILEARKNGYKVIMIGDGLNDAGALLQSDVGIVVSEDTNNFSPACDAIIDSTSFGRLPDFLRFAKAGKRVIKTTFGISLVYNVIGLTFAVQGSLSPVIAAILMPVSSVSIVLLATISTTIISRKYKL
jgi:Cu+-exporting ATPase